MDLQQKIRQSLSEGTKNCRLKGKRVFLSASYPSPERDLEYFKGTDNREISNAVVELARAVFSEGGGLVFGGHPTITPLIRSIGEEMGLSQTPRQRVMVSVYQSAVFNRDRAPDSLEFRSLDFVEEILVPQANGEQPKFTDDGTLQAESVAGSLEIMRTEMISAPRIVAAVFIGGMDGTIREFEIARGLPNVRCYLVAAPGGAVRKLARKFPLSPTDCADGLKSALRSSRLYPWLLQSVIKDCIVKGTLE